MSPRKKAGQKRPRQAKKQKQQKQQKQPKQQKRQDETCSKCGECGELLLCDSCTNSYHMACLDPPLTVVPSGAFHCPACWRAHHADRRCACCQRSGGWDLSSCDQCGTAFHLSCVAKVVPPDSSNFCPMCSKTQADRDADRAARLIAKARASTESATIRVCTSLELSERARLLQILSGEAHYLTTEHQFEFLSAYLLHDSRAGSSREDQGHSAASASAAASSSATTVRSKRRGRS